jgi:hypothetical protein
MATDWLKSQYPNDHFNNEVRIDGGSAKNNGEYGWADIVEWGASTVEVWEVKQAGGPAEKAGPAQLNRYVEKLQEMLVAAGDPRLVDLGGDVVPELGPTPSLGNPNKLITARSTTGGIITYTVHDIDNPNTPIVPSPTAGPSPTATPRVGLRPEWIRTRPLYQPSQSGLVPAARVPVGTSSSPWESFRD